MEETLGDAAAISGILFADQMYGSVEDKVGGRPTCHGLHVEAEHGDPTSRV
jgi:hypothetical protein